MAFVGFRLQFILRLTGDMPTIAWPLPAPPQCAIAGLPLSGSVAPGLQPRSERQHALDSQLHDPAEGLRQPDPFCRQLPTHRQRQHICGLHATKQTVLFNTGGPCRLSQSYLCRGITQACGYVMSP